MKIAPITTLILAGIMSSSPAQESFDTRVGKLSFTQDFTSGYPTNETVELLYDEIDFQRACQAYLWSIPIVSFAEWQHSHEVTFGAKSGDVVVYDNYLAKLGILTANAPVAQFWSMTIYDVGSRGLIDNPSQQADRSSRMDLQKNEDGSVDLFVGPAAPEGKESNWVETVPGRAWFSYFRLYGPEEAHFNGSWVLPDFEKLTD